LFRQDKNKHVKSGAGPYSAPGFFRRLAAIVYDLFLLIALLFVATAILLPINSGVAFSSRQYFFPIYLLTVSCFFYAWFWTHGGQTLGMRAWKIKVLTFNFEPISWRQGILRFGAAIASLACFGLGFLWILIDKNRRGWHDYLSQTALFLETEDSDR
jgi:uncharacterized RDD family membrane protein YckC